MLGIMRDRKIIIYSPKREPIWSVKSWRNMLCELIDNRELIWRLFVRDFTAKYRQTLLGVLWAILTPLVTIGTFLYLNKAGVFDTGETSVPYPAYAILGLTIWQLFSGGVAASYNSIVAAGSMVGKINFPKEALVIAAFGQTAVDVLIRAVITFMIFLYYKISPPGISLLAPLLLVPLLLLTLGTGFILSILNSFSRDISNVVNLVLGFLLLLTPILYNEPKSDFFGVVNHWNPLSVLVCTPRDLILSGSFANPDKYLLVSFASFVFFLVCWRVFHIAEYRIAEKIGGR